jgi:catechol 2,3-dioxygenase-like lactoylglutathione lyase family enzyme
MVVADVESAGNFYVEVFGAEWRVRPIVMGPPDAAFFMAGPAETSFDLAMVGLGDGSVIELFHFRGEQVPDWLRPNAGLMPHMCIQVDDVAAALARAERLGATRVWDDAVAHGPGQVIYIRDPDGNAIEVIDVSVDVLIGTVLESFPDGRP